MKACFLILVLFIPLLGWAEDMTLLDGSVLKNVTIISADAERLLLVHDGGGQQIEYAQLKAITPAQRVKIESLLKKYAERKEKREELLFQQKAFEQTQLEKGLVKFEDNWITPSERQQILTLREVARLERERMQIELAQQKVELRQAELEAQQGDELLSGPSSRSSFIYYTGRNWPAFGRNGGVFTYAGSGYWFPGYTPFGGRACFRSSGISVGIGAR